MGNKLISKPVIHIYINLWINIYKKTILKYSIAYSSKSNNSVFSIKRKIHVYLRIDISGNLFHPVSCSLSIVLFYLSDNITLFIPFNINLTGSEADNRYVAAITQTSYHTFTEQKIGHRWNLRNRKFRWKLITKEVIS